MNQVQSKPGLLRRRLIGAALSATGGLATAAAAQTGTTINAGDESFYEWRLYQIQQGRMADMHARMRNDLLRLFARHGMSVAGAWQQGASPSPQFVYLLRWKSWAARLLGWSGFYADPEWLEVRARTNAGSDLVQRQHLVMVRALTPVGPTRAWTEQALFSIPVTIGRLPALVEALPLVTASQKRNGGELLGAFEHLFGEDVPRVFLLTGGPTPDLTAIDHLTDGGAIRYALKATDYPVN